MLYVQTLPVSRIYASAITTAVILLSALCGCSTSDRAAPKLQGEWNALAAAVETETGVREEFIVDQYGYGSLTLRSDRTFESSLGVLNDIVITRDVFGREIRKTIVDAKVQIYKTGTYNLRDSSLTLIQHDGDTLLRGTCYFERHKLVVQFSDGQDRSWHTEWKSVN